MYKKFPIDEKELTSTELKRLDDLYDHLVEMNKYFVGYQCTSNLDYSELYRFMNFPVNNIGDPFATTTFKVNTRDIERDVIRWFADLHHLPREECWGYVTNGGTEGNLYGLYLARELMPRGIVYHSEDVHYSVSKNLRVLNMRYIMIKSQANGEMDYEDLRESIQFNSDVPPIIFATAGTTMKEAVDDINRIKDILNGLGITASYIHCDAALCGMTRPFIEHSRVFDFRAGIDSMSISGHKFIGSPIPCGVVLAKKRYVERIARAIEYVGILDTTIPGSRNGITPLFLWYAIHKTGRAGFKHLVEGCLEMAAYTEEKLRSIGLAAWRNENAITVVFPRPPKPVLDKWQIAVYGRIAHIITMPSIGKKQIDELVHDIKVSLEEKSLSSEKTLK